MTVLSTHARRILGAGALCGLMLVGGCSRDGKFAPVDMWNRSRLKPYEPVGFFADGSSSRPLVEGTVARGQLRTDEAFYQGTINGAYVTQIPRELTRAELDSGKTFAPQPVTRAMLERGRERYTVNCQPCHGLNGYGDGMIVKRGFSPPPSYHIARLRNAPVGHFYDVISNGYGAMYSYASRVEPQDRWAIAAYIRALQRSQHPQAGDIPQAELNTLPTTEQVEKAGAAPLTDTPGTPGDVTTPHASQKSNAEAPLGTLDKTPQKADQGMH